MNFVEIKFFESFIQGVQEYLLPFEICINLAKTCKL